MMPVALMEHIPERTAEIHNMPEPQHDGKQNTGRQNGTNERNSPYQVVHSVHNLRQ